MTKKAVSGTDNTNGRKTTPRPPGRKHAAKDDAASSLPVLATSDDTPYLTGKSERAIYNRLSRLEGQVRGVKRMLADHKSCDAMLVQVSALKQAVNGIAAELLQAHMETCVRSRVEAGDGERALASLRDALAKVMKHG
jgi:CsoR family transcriptional regulator, copper-sensing transcriptional repressor